jgi:hypothetical protein
MMRNLDAPKCRMIFLPDDFRSAVMMDIVFVAAIVAFFAISVGLVRFCAGLLSGGGRP